MVSWKNLDIDKVKTLCNRTYERYTEYPSLRDIFYTFVGELWPNTRSAYQGLSKWLRDKRIEDRIDWHIIRDGSGRELNQMDNNYFDKEWYVDTIKSSFKNQYKYYVLPKWMDQPHRVFVVCEKEADYPIVKSILYNEKVYVGYMRGYTGWRLLFEIQEAIEKEDCEPVIIALGDFDPSGQDIVRFVKEAIKDTLGIDLVKDPIKVSITKEQIEKFNLPHKPEDEAEIKKLQKDPRFKKWPYGFYRVETASLRNRHPDYFDDILRKTVKQFFDEEIYEEVNEEQIKAQAEIKDQIDRLVARWED